MNHHFNRILDRLTRVRRSGNGYMATCPAHDDRNPSLSLKEGDDGRVLLHCHAGCEFDTIVDALGLTASDLFPADGSTGGPSGHRQPAPESQPASRYSTAKETVTASYSYRDAARLVVAIKERYDGHDGKKTFTWHGPDGTAGLGGRSVSSLPLYGLPELLASPTDEPVFFVEGEKACDAARRLGFTAVSLAGGAGQEDFGEALEPLRNRKVILWPDEDDQGRALMRRVGTALAGIAAQLRWLHVPGLPPKGDAADFEAVRQVDELRTHINLAQPFLPSSGVGGGAGQKGISPAEEVDPRWIVKEIGELSRDGATVEWIWLGFLALRSVTLLTGLWKAGKTTLLSHLLGALMGAGRDFLNQAVNPTKILLITEESEQIWAIRRDDLSLGNHVHVMSRPFMTRPDKKIWARFIAYVAERVKLHGYMLVVFDALPNLWSVQDENAAADVLTALMPLNAITEAGAGVLLLAHPKKGDATEGQATRGSGAIAGFVDVIVEMRRFDPARREDNRRVLTTYSRYDETPAETVVEYHPMAGYWPTGTKADAKASDRLALVVELLGDPPGKTVEKILEAWPEDCEVPKPGARTLRRDLSDAFQKGRIERGGDGKREDPYRYHLPQAQDSYPASSTPIEAPAGRNPLNGNGADEAPPSGTSQESTRSESAECNSQC